MKSPFIKTIFIAATILLSGCTTFGTGSSTTGTSGTSDDLISAGAAILENLLGGLLSNTITEQSFVGTWTYLEPQVRFESEDLLKKAGGAVVAQTIEKNLDKYLSKIGITKGTTTYTFNSDKTFKIQTKGHTISSGTYSYDRSTKTLNLNGTLGIMNQKCTVGLDGTNLCLLYDADKLLNVMNGIGALLGKNSSLGSIASVFGQNYDGMKVGFSLKKQAATN